MNAFGSHGVSSRGRGAGQVRETGRADGAIGYHKIAFSLNPRINYIFVTHRIAVDQARVPPRSAGDHFPVRAALKKGA